MIRFLQLLSQIASNFSKLKPVGKFISEEDCCSGLSPALSHEKSCYNVGATEATEEALGARGCLRIVPYLLSHQHTQTGTSTHSTSEKMGRVVLNK